MTVYVDRATHKPGKPRTCRMVADTNSELESIVESLGIRKRRIHCELSLPYIELCKLERDRAIELGAKEVTVTSMCATLKKFNHPQPAAQPPISSHR